MHHRFIPTLGKAEKTPSQRWETKKNNKNCISARAENQNTAIPSFWPEQEALVSTSFGVDESMKSFLRSLVERLVFAIFFVSVFWSSVLKKLARTRPLSLSLYIYNKVSLLSSDVIPFHFFCLFLSLSTFPKTFIIFSNYSFESLVCIYFCITFALAFAFFWRLYIEIVLWKIYIERDR